MTKITEDYEDEGTEMMKLLGTAPKRTITRSMSLSEHYYPLTYEIQSFEQVEELIKLLMTSNSGDLVKLYICSPGGNLAVSEQIVSAIADAQQRNVCVVAKLGFQACSAASFIALACDDIEVSPNTSMMIHMWTQWGGYGITTHLTRDLEYSHKQSIRFMRETYLGFLSESELNDLIEHPKDLWFDAEDILERWDNMMTYREQQFLKSMSDDGESEQVEAPEEPEPTPPKKTRKPRKKAE